MKMYVASRANYGYQGRYWRSGETVEWREGMPKPPEHFRLVVGTEDAATTRSEDAEQTERKTSKAK